MKKKNNSIFSPVFTASLVGLGYVVARGRQTRLKVASSSFQDSLSQGGCSLSFDLWLWGEHKKKKKDSSRRVNAAQQQNSAVQTHTHTAAVNTVPFSYVFFVPSRLHPFNHSWHPASPLRVTEAETKGEDATVNKFIVAQTPHVM